MSRARQPELERELLQRIARSAKARLGVDARSYPDAVGRQLAAGELLFGDTFLEKDCLAEAREEAVDLGAWALLELERLTTVSYVTDPVRDDLMRVIMLGAAADFYARRARRLRDDTERERRRR